MKPLDQQKADVLVKLKKARLMIDWKLSEIKRKVENVLDLAESQVYEVLKCARSRTALTSAKGLASDFASSKRLIQAAPGLRLALENGQRYANEIIKTWDSGGLAEAVNRLREWSKNEAAPALKAAKANRGTRVKP